MLSLTYGAHERSLLESFNQCREQGGRPEIPCVSAGQFLRIKEILVPLARDTLDCWLRRFQLLYLSRNAGLSIYTVDQSRPYK